MTRYLTRGNIFWGILLITLSSIDAFLTNYLIGTGAYKEGNPLIIFSGSMLYLKSIIWIPIIVIALRMNNRISLRRVLIALCVALTIVVAWNSYQVGL